MDQQILHITEEQLQCIAQKVYETAESAVDCVDRVKFPIEIIDLNRGLDADLYCNIYVSNPYPSEDEETEYTVIYAQLVTYIEGEEVPNDTSGTELAAYITRAIN